MVLLGMDMAPHLNAACEALLKQIAWKRYLLALRSGRLGAVLRAEPRVKDSTLGLIRASTRLSQGRWLASLAMMPGVRPGGEPRQVVELGTAVGMSGMYLLAGLHASGGGHLTTFEGSPARSEVARHHFDTLIREQGLRDVSYEIVEGRFDDTVEPFFLAKGPQFDLVFIDGYHLEVPTLKYHRLALSRMNPRGIIVHDDIDWSEEMARAWTAIKESLDCRVEELFLGGRPSRGIAYLGEKTSGAVQRHDLDGFAERTARRLYFSLRPVKRE